MRAALFSRIAVTTPAGTITVTAGNSGSASVTAAPRYQHSAPVITSQLTGGVLTVAATCPRVSQDCQVSLPLSVPSGVPVTAATDLGAVRLAGLSGDVTVHTDQGAISAIGLAAPRADLSTDLGNIDALFWVPPTRVTASTQEGSVTIRLPSTTTYDVTASAQLGSTSVAVPQSASSAHVIKATSQLGSVTVTG